MKLISGRLGQYYWHRYCRLLIPHDPFSRIGKDIYVGEKLLAELERWPLFLERAALEEKLIAGRKVPEWSREFDLWNPAYEPYVDNPVYKPVSVGKVLWREHLQFNHRWFKLRQVGRQPVFSDYPSLLKYKNIRQYQFYGGYGRRWRDAFWVKVLISQYDVRFFRSIFFW